MNKQDIQALQALVESTLMTDLDKKNAYDIAMDIKNTVNDMQDVVKSLWIKIIQTNGAVSDQDISDTIKSIK